MADARLTDSVAVDKDEVARFLRLGTPDFFEYEYCRYDPQRSVFVQARQEGKLVGTQAAIPYPLRIDGQVIMTARSERTMADPQMRGAGLFPRMMELCVEQAAAKGLQFIWGTTTLKGALQRTGFLYTDKFYEHALLCLRPFAVRRDFAQTASRRERQAKLATVLPSLALRTSASLLPRGSLLIQDRPNSYDDVSELYEALRGTQPLVVMHQEERLLHWLFDQAGRSVNRYYGYRGSTLMGYAYVDRTDGTTAHLVDFAARTAADMRTLLDVIIRDLRDRGDVFLHAAYNCWNPLLRRMRLALLAVGFVPVYRGGGFVVRPIIYRDMNYLADLSRWYITRLWFQLYPGS